MAALIITGLLLLISSISTTSQEVRHAAVSSDISFCFGPCAPHHRYRLSYKNEFMFNIPCYSTSPVIIPDKISGRQTFNETSGCLTLSNVSKSDAGRYQREHVDANGKIVTLPAIEVQVLDKACIRELSRNGSDRNISLSVVCTGEPDTIIWTMDGGHLPDRHWLSDNNRTLTVPYNITGTFMVNASNLVSVECRNITIIGYNVKSSHLGPVMYRNISRVIWGEGGGAADNQTLILPRNVTALYVMAVSESLHEPQYKRPNRYYRLLLLIPVLCIFILPLACLLVKRRRAQQNGRPGHTMVNHLHDPSKENVLLFREQESIPVTNGDYPHHGGEDEAAVDHVNRA